MAEINRKGLAGIRTFLILILAFHFGLVFPGLYANAEDGPHLILPESKYNFNLVPEGELVRHEFAVKNTGNLPLSITGIQTD